VRPDNAAPDSRGGLMFHMQCRYGYIWDGIVIVVPISYVAQHCSTEDWHAVSTKRAT